jgi:hypothetical protein
MSQSSPVVVAVAACRTEDGTAIYPDADWPLLRDAFTQAGCRATQLAWDDEAVAWQQFDAVIVRSTWDSVDRPHEYLAWADRVEQATRLINPASVLRWNLDKRYLRDLAAAGIAVVDTQWIGTGDHYQLPANSFVVKPAISAGGRETARYEPGDVGADAHIKRLLDHGHTVMVQPLIESVETKGESKSVLIGSRFSHAMKVGAFLRPGQTVLDRPWEVSVQTTVQTPSHSEIEIADQVMSFVHDRFGVIPVYARVDTVMSPSSEPMVLEVELIDPALFLRASPDAAARLVDAVVQSAKG